jgi:hypothetical protein
MLFKSILDFMRVLIHGPLPPQVRGLLASHDVVGTEELGWDRLDLPEILDRVRETAFDIAIVATSLRYGPRHNAPTTGQPTAPALRILVHPRETSEIRELFAFATLSTSEDLGLAHFAVADLADRAEARGFDFIVFLNEPRLSPRHQFGHVLIHDENAIPLLDFLRQLAEDARTPSPEDARTPFRATFSTTARLGWTSLGAAQLLNVAEKAGFTILVVTRARRFSEDLVRNRRLAVIELWTRVPSRLWQQDREVSSALKNARSGTYRRIRRPPRVVEILVGGCLIGILGGLLVLGGLLFDWLWPHPQPVPQPPQPVRLASEAASRLAAAMQRERPKFTLPSAFDKDCIKREILTALAAAGYQAQLPAFDDFDRLITHEKRGRAEINTDRKRFERSVISACVLNRGEEYNVFLNATGMERRREEDFSDEESIDDRLLSRFVDRLAGQMDFNHCRPTNRLTAALVTGLPALSAGRVVVFLPRGYPHMSTLREQLIRSGARQFDVLDLPTNGLSLAVTVTNSQASTNILRLAVSVMTSPEHYTHVALPIFQEGSPIARALSWPTDFTLARFPEEGNAGGENGLIIIRLRYDESTGAFQFERSEPAPPPPLANEAVRRLDEALRRDRPKFTIPSTFDKDCIKREILAALAFAGYEPELPAFDDFDRLITHEKRSTGEINTERRRFERSVMSACLLLKGEEYNVFLNSVGKERRRERDFSDEEPIEERLLSRFVDRLAAKMDFNHCNPTNHLIAAFVMGLPNVRPDCVVLILLPRGYAHMSNLREQVMHSGARQFSTGDLQDLPTNSFWVAITVTKEQPSTNLLRLVVSGRTSPERHIHVGLPLLGGVSPAAQPLSWPGDFHLMRFPEWLGDRGGTRNTIVRIRYNEVTHAFQFETNEPLLDR